MINVIKEVSKKDLKDFLYSIDLKDPQLYSELNDKSKIGIFQISGATARRFCDEVKPKKFSEVVAVNAISRPGPLESSGPFYLSRKAEADSPYPKIINNILKDTHYTMLYQEQIMEIFHQVGNFTLEEANEVRSVMKKLSKAEKNEEDLKQWKRIIKRFVRGAVKNGLSEEMAIKITDDLKAFAQYSFNYSHATAYAYIAMMTLYLSNYFKPYWYSSILTYEIDKKKHIQEYIRKIKSEGVSIVPLDINASTMYFSPLNEKTLMFGLTGIKFVSEKAAKKIIEKRPYNDLFDFIIKTRSREINSSTIKALISTGAFDKFDKNRTKLLKAFKIFWESKKNIKVEEKLKAIWQEANDKVSLLSINTSLSNLIDYEIEYIGFPLFTDYFDDKVLKLINIMEERKLVITNINDVNKFAVRIPLFIKRIRSHIDKNKNNMCFIQAEDINGNDISFPIFHSYYKVLKDKLKKNIVYVVSLYRKEDSILFGSPKYITNEFVINRMLKRIS